MTGDHRGVLRADGEGLAIATVLLLSRADRAIE